MLDISNCDVIYYVIYVIFSHYIRKAISPLFAWPSSLMILQSLEKKARYGSDPSLIEDRIATIERKIKDKKLSLQTTDNFHGQKALTRHEMEVERSLLRESGQASQKLTKMLTKVEVIREISHPDDPMNHLEDILATVCNKSAKRAGLSKRERRKQRRQMNACNDECCNSEKCNVEVNDELNVMIGCHPKEANFQSSAGCLEQSQCTDVSTCSYNTCKSDEDGEKDVTSQSVNAESVSNIDQNRNQPVELCSRVCFIPDSEIEGNRLSEEDIRKLPRFENYSAGIPSKVCTVLQQCMPIIFMTHRSFSVILSSHIGNPSEFASVMTDGPMLLA